ncbi:hypothetical protein Cob_v008999 [Colletotrichum orbiculare MAFF 240422]|uniref:Glycoside hydrolase 131 catalytic N-terminal domain-containing protein n=1 Tax=Colletotrichum orbiculare (strain 104-T / ATCC 96160 / CBS 514.97 / LARS 414 / MAFF 240422) TaxID=1213857 RepID=A0A484FLB5_COLOR|nr:hypothetical protein Cob_v008999 [Colletotrichum orbiculare MAFF 240422]
MKSSFLTLIGLLAASVAAGPVPADVGSALEARANGDGSKNAGKDSGKKGTGGTATGGEAKAGNTSALVLPDGRIKADATPESFNVLESVFKSAVVKGDGLKFSDVITFPKVDASLFDKATNTKAFAINIDDKSVFVPKGGEAQSNIRRADLLPSIRSQANDVAVTGVFNLESKDFSFHQIDVRTGAENGKEIAIFGNSKTTGGAPKIFSTPFGEGKFENFAIKMDFTANTVQVFHSSGNDPLKQVTEPVKNDLAGLGEYHFSLQKNPVGQSPQPAGIKEAVIFGGIFMEDSTSNPVTLQ